MELISEVGLNGARPVLTPLIGKLIYLIITRLAYAFLYMYLSQFLERPTYSLLEAAMGVILYLKGSPSLGFFFPSNTTHELPVYCDSDWATCSNTRRSVIGYVVKLGGALLSWRSKK